VSESRPEPIVLELAPLPREQIGPFLLLGLDKDAEARQIEAHWAQRLIWARKNQLGVGLEEIHWAREVLRDPDRRLSADLASLNPDTIAGTLRQLEERYGLAESAPQTWVPLDVEKPIGDQAPPAGVPDAREFRRSIEVPEVPPEAPAVARLLEDWLREPIDPWLLDLPLAANPNEVA
jgi:hypothetical protein